MNYKAMCLIKEQACLGEGVIWDEHRKSIHYVDITGHKIHTYNLNQNTYTTVSVKETVGCIVLDEEGNLIAALRDTLVKLNPETGNIKPLLQLELPDYLRFNDGKCDSRGRLWAGTMAADQSHINAKHGGTLYMIENSEKVYPMLERLTISNGICWGEEGLDMYHIDTATQQIMGYDFCKETGTISNPRVAVEVPIEEGSPDGMTIDRDGMLWVALWGGYKICRYNPLNGEKLCEVAFPAKNVTCCTFGGELMNELFITTAMDEDGTGGEVYHVITDTAGYAPYKFK